MGVRQMPFQKGTGGPQYAGYGIGGSGGGGGSYTLPTATESRLGGVKIGDNVDVTEDGTISVDLTEIDSQVTTVSLRLDEIDSQVTTVSGEVRDLDAAVDRLERSLKTKIGEVVADGVKTISAILDELYGMIDSISLNRDYEIVDRGGVYMSTQIESNRIDLSHVLVDVNTVTLYGITLRSNGSTLRYARNNFTIQDVSSSVPESGSIITLYVL